MVMSLPLPRSLANPTFQGRLRENKCPEACVCKADYTCNDTSHFTSLAFRFDYGTDSQVTGSNLVAAYHRCRTYAAVAKWRFLRLGRFTRGAFGALSRFLLHIDQMEKALKDKPDAADRERVPADHPYSYFASLYGPEECAYCGQKSCHPLNSFVKDIVDDYCQNNAVATIFRMLSLYYNCTAGTQLLASRAGNYYRQAPKPPTNITLGVGAPMVPCGSDSDYCMDGLPCEIIYCIVDHVLSQKKQYLNIRTNIKLELCLGSVAGENVHPDRGPPARREFSNTPSRSFKVENNSSLETPRMKQSEDGIHVVITNHSPATTLSTNQAITIVYGSEKKSDWKGGIYHVTSQEELEIVTQALEVMYIPLKKAVDLSGYTPLQRANLEYMGVYSYDGAPVIDMAARSPVAPHTNYQYVMNKIDLVMTERASLPNRLSSMNPSAPGFMETATAKIAELVNTNTFQAFAKSAAQVSAITLIVCNLIIFARACATMTKWDVMLSLTALTLSVTNFLVLNAYKCVDKIVNSIGHHILQYVYCDRPDDSTAWTFMSIISRLAVIFVSTIACALGYRGISNLTASFRLANDLGDSNNGLLAVIAKAFGITSDDDVVHAQFIAYVARADDYLSLPASKWVGGKFAEIKAWLEEARDVLKQATKACATPVAAQLSTKITMIDEQVKQLNLARCARKERMVPAAIFIYGPPGLGKTALARYIPKVIAKSVDGFNDEVYFTNASAKHASVYQGEHTMHIDEVGALADSPDPIFESLNDIISSNSVPSPTAGLGGKEQVISPKLVIMTANKPMSHVPTGLSAEAKAALTSRIMRFEIRDPQYDPTRKNARTNQTHRKDDFSHLEFWAGTGNAAKRFDVKTLCHEIINTMAHNKRSFDSTDDPTVVEVNYRVRGAKLNLGDEPQAGTDSFCVWIAGKPGTCKTSIHRPGAENAARERGYRISTDINDCTNLDNTLIVLDDWVNETNQDLLMDAINRSGTNIKWLVISNYGPSCWSPAWYAGYDKMTIRPGLHRRFGLYSKSPAGFLAVTSPTGVATLVNEPKTPTFTKAWYGHFLDVYDNGAAFPTNMARFDGPEFEKHEADVWIEAERLTRAEFLAALPSTSLRVYNVIRQLDTNPQPGTMDRYMMNNMTRIINTYSDLKIYVKSGSVVYYVNGTKYYKGCPPTPTRIYGRKIYFPNGDSMELNDEFALAFYANQRQIEPRAIMAADALALSRLDGSQLFLTFTTMFPPAEDDYRRFNAVNLQAIAAKSLMWLKANMAIMAVFCLFVVAAGVAMWMYGLHRSSRPSTQVDCSSCVVDGEYIPSPMCQGDIADAGGRARFAKDALINGNRVIISDAEFEGSYNERVFHDVNKYFRANGFKAGTYRVTIPSPHGDRDVEATCSWDQGRIRYSWDYLDEPMAAHEDVMNNRVKLATISSNLYGLMLNSNVCRFPRHLLVYVSNPNARKEAFLTDDPEVKLSVIYEDASNDVCYARLVKNGKPYNLPGMKTITNHLVSEDQLPSVKRCYVVDPKGYSFHHSDYAYEPVLSNPVNCATACVNSGAVVHYSGQLLDFLTEGTCGALALAKIDGATKIVGQYHIRRQGYQTHIFTIPTVQEWNRVMQTQRDTPDAASRKPLSEAISEVEWFLHPNTREFCGKVYTPKSVLDLCAPSDPDGYYPEGCFTNVGSMPGVVSNFDSKCRKTPLLSGALSPVCGNLKRPAYAMKVVERDFADKIPPDSKGRLHAQNIRLSASVNNVIAGAPWNKVELVNVMTNCAYELGKYWRKQTGFDGDFLSFYDSIWGNGEDVSGFHHDSSSGAIFLTLFKGCQTKGDIYGPQRGDFKGEPGKFAKEMGEEQWRAWCRGDQLQIPVTYMTKDETLLNEKAWRKRLIGNMDPVTSSNGRRVLTPPRNAFASLGARSPLVLDMNPLLGFNDMVCELRRFKWFTDLDCSSYDLTVAVLAAVLIAWFLYAFYNVTEKWRRDVIFQCCVAMMLTPALIKKDLFSKLGAIISGMPETNVWDGLFLMIMTYFYADRVHYASLYDLSPEQFYDRVWVYLCGDDMIGASDDPNFFAGFANYMNHTFNMKFTASGNKDSSQTVTTNLEDISFCSRQFHQMPNSYWTGRLKQSSISGILCWTRDPTSEAMLLQLTQACVEVSLWPELCDKFNAAIRQHKLDVPLADYDAICGDIAQGIVSGRVEQRLKPSFGQTLTTIVVEREKPVEDPKTQFNIDRMNAKVARNFRIALKRAYDAGRPLDVKSTKAYKELLAIATPLTQPDGNPLITSPGYWKSVVLALEGELPEWVNNVLAQTTNSPPGGKKRRAFDFRRKLANTLKKHDVHMLSDLVAMIKDHPELGLEFLDCAAHDTEDSGSQGIEVPGSTEEEINEFLRVVFDSFSINMESQNPMAGGHEPKQAMGSNKQQSSQGTTAGSALGAAGAPSSSSATNGTDIAGVEPNPLQPQALSGAQAVVPIAGSAEAPPMLASAGGFEPTSITQTGTCMNVLSAAATYVFVDLVNVTTGTGEGVTVLEVGVDPWSKKWFGEAVQQWAELHTRFRGLIEFKVACIASGTAIGTVLFAYVPAIFDDMEITQQNLNYFNATEINLAASGEGTILVNPTIGENAVTGIYRGKRKSWGRLVGITGSNITNSFTNQMAIQLKFYSRLHPGAAFDVPRMLQGPDVKTATEDMDIGKGFEDPILSVDGNLFDFTRYEVTEGINGYPFIPSPSGLVIAVPIVDTSLSAEGPWGYDCYGGKLPTYKGHPDDWDDFTYITYGIASYADGAYNVQISHEWRAVMQQLPGDETVHYTNIKGQPSYYGGYFGKDNHNGNWLLYDSGQYDKVIVRAGPTVGKGEAGTLCPANQWGFTSVTEATQPTMEAMGDRTVSPPEPLCVQDTPTVKLTSVPICTKGMTVTPAVPDGLYAVKATERNEVVPAVAVGMKGATMVPNVCHTAAMLSAIHNMRKNNAASVVTQITSAEGALVAEILRNEKGMFISSSGLEQYMRLTSQLGTVKQTHSYKTTEFPVLRESKSSSFRNRMVTNTCSAVYSGKIHTGTTPPELLTTDCHETELPSSGIKATFNINASVAAAVAAGGTAMKGLGDLTSSIGNIVNTQKALDIVQQNVNVRKARLAFDKQAFQQTMALNQGKVNERAMQGTAANGSSF